MRHYLVLILSVHSAFQKLFSCILVNYSGIQGGILFHHNQEISSVAVKAALK